MDEADRDGLMRMAAFEHVRKLGEVHDERENVSPILLNSIELWSRPAPLRAVPAARGDRAPHHQGQAPVVERHRRAAAPHAAG
jgi:hypothetical protein